MKKTIISTFILLLNLSVGYAQQCAWAKQGNGQNTVSNNSVITDAAGNIYTAGTFNSPYDYFDTTILSNTNYYQNIYLVKYNSSGTVLWAKNFGGDNNASVDGITIDKAGYLYLTGNFTGSSLTFGSFTLTNQGGDDIYIAKFDEDGNTIWAKNYQGKSVVAGIGTDASGHIYIAGYYDSSLTFNSTNLTNTGSKTNIFAAKFDTNGANIWAISQSGISSGNPLRIKTKMAVDQAGNLYISANYYRGIIAFGSISLTISNGESFILKFNTSGTAESAKIIGDTGHSQMTEVEDMVTDIYGNLYVTGNFQSHMLIFGVYILYNPSYRQSSYLAKFSQSGSVQWANCIESTSGVNSNGIATDRNGDVYITGWNYGSSTFFGASTMTTQGFFLTKYNTYGDEMWFKGCNADNGGVGYSIAPDGMGNVYLAGMFGGPVSNIDSVKLIPYNGTGNAFTIKFIDETAGVPQISNEGHFSVFPNPATGIINISSANKISMVTISNITGQPVFTGEYGSDQVQINVADLKPGIYCLKINNSEVRKFVKQ